jgi:hypothetical protein
MTDQRREIDQLTRALTALLDNSDAGPGSKAVATLLVASVFVSRTDMPPHLAAAMLADYCIRRPTPESLN